MKKVLMIILIIVIALAAIILFSRRGEAPPALTGVEVLGSDTTGAINESLNSLDLGDLDAEFQAIDADLNSL